MSIEILQTHYGFTRMPFGRDLAPNMLGAPDVRVGLISG